jgi:hypothetical protein
LGSWEEKRKSGDFWDKSGKKLGTAERSDRMRKKNFKGRCTKKTVSKAEGVCRTYDALQLAALEELEQDNIKTVGLQGIDCVSHKTQLPPYR